MLHNRRMLLMRVKEVVTRMVKCYKSDDEGDGNVMMKVMVMACSRL